MRHIKTNTLTVEQFLEKLHTRTNFSTQDHSDYSEITIKFNSAFKWGDGNERIHRLFWIMILTHVTSLKLLSMAAI